MKKSKKTLLFFMSFVLALSFLIAPFPQKQKIACSAPSDNDIHIIDESLSNYVTISTDGQTLTKDEIKNVDSDLDGELDTSYVFSNRTVTMTFEPLVYSYNATFDSRYFYKTTREITVTKLASDPEFPLLFTDGETEYSYIIDGANNVTITNTQTTRTFRDSDFFTYNPANDTETTRTFTVVTAYTLTADAPNTSFTFIASNSSDNASKVNSRTINFERTVTDFKTEYVTLFTCVGLDVGNTPYTTPEIEKELSYENIKLQITNNDYTESNPLYFDINYNGFAYTFKLFSKLVGADELLFVEYYDNQRNSNNQSLATKLSEDGTVITPIYKYYGPVENKEFNTFSIDFKKTGRYEIAFYDETYLLNLKDYNYFSTSFYIKSSEGAFENAYAIMQNYDDEGNFSNYIVSGSYQNANVQITIKNLLFYFENDEFIKTLTPEEADVVPVVELIEAKLTGSLNIPTSTPYTVSEIKELLAETPDLKINCENDSFYKIVIHKFQRNGDGSVPTKVDNSIANTSYQFTIVKQPKISFKVTKVDENNDPIPIPGTKEFETEPKEADIPYALTPVDYKLNINSNMEFSTFFKNPSTTRTTVLDKTYLNEYTINYAMQLVKIERITVYEEGSTDTVLKVLGIQFFGVGDINVKVTVGAITSEYTVQTGETLIFENYGVYKFTITDTMNTTTTAEFSWLKPTSVSAIILIGLVGIIVLAVVLFVISARGKVATR